MANCSVNWTIFNGNIPDPLIYFFIFYCYAICFVGTLCNVVAMWCVVSCPRTRPPVKVLLCALFSTTFLMCLLVMPFMAHVGISKVHCSKQVPRLLVQAVVYLYIILTLMELLYITTMAFLRAMGVWSSKKQQMKMRTAVTLSVGAGIYSTATTMLLLAPIWVDNYTALVVGLIYSTAHNFAPVVLTLACYLSMMFAVWRNKRRLAASQDAVVAGLEVMDQATRAMLAVFISNLLLGLPHSIYHILPYDYHVFSYVIVH